MGTNKITEQNKLIAVFMGFNMIVENYHGINIIESPLGKTYDLHGLKYHSSWDWIMPVVERIENTRHETALTGHHVEITGSICRIQPAAGFHNRAFRETFNEGSKIKSVYGAVVTFIEWYNNSI